MFMDDPLLNIYGLLIEYQKICPLKLFGNKAKLILQGLLQFNDQGQAYFHNIQSITFLLYFIFKFFNSGSRRDITFIKLCRCDVMYELFHHYGSDMDSDKHGPTVKSLTIDGTIKNAYIFS